MNGIRRPARECIINGCSSMATRGDMCERCRATIGHMRDYRHNNDHLHVAYRSTEYQRARRVALSRQHDCTLQHIGGCNGGLHVHHISGDNTDNRQANLAVLCQRHHMKLEKEPDRAGVLGKALAQALAELQGAGH